MLSSEVFGNTGGCQPLQHLGRTVGEDVRKGSELVAGRNLFKSREPMRGFLGFESSAGMPIRGPGLGREPRSSISQCSLNKVRFKPPFSYGASARLLHSVLGSVDHESLFFDPLSTPFPFRKFSFCLRAPRTFTSVSRRRCVRSPAARSRVVPRKGTKPCQSCAPRAQMASRR